MLHSLQRLIMEDSQSTQFSWAYLTDTGVKRTSNEDAAMALVLNLDSLNPVGAHKDRHARIGEGTLGAETFRRIVNHPALRRLPMLLETPNELPGYAAEIALLRGFEEAE